MGAAAQMKEDNAAAVLAVPSLTRSTKIGNEDLTPSDRKAFRCKSDGHISPKTSSETRTSHSCIERSILASSGHSSKSVGPTDSDEVEALRRMVLQSSKLLWCAHGAKTVERRVCNEKQQLVDAMLSAHADNHSCTTDD